MQSSAREHILPAAQPAHEVPPQSTSLSSWFLTLSLQVGAWQAPPLHTRLLQSLPTPQRLPVPQAAHTPPPQSTSLSLPSWTPSIMQVGGGVVHPPFRQVPDGQTWLHVPQWLGSAWVFTQAPPQSFCPLPQAMHANEAARGAQEPAERVRTGSNAREGGH